VGDNVNIAARLAAAAGAGEVLVSTDAATQTDLDLTGLARRTLELKGKSGGTEVVSVKVTPPAADSG
jgi:class 3 adenylate cyclase